MAVKSKLNLTTFFSASKIQRLEFNSCSSTIIIDVDVINVVVVDVVMAAAAAGR